MVPHVLEVLDRDDIAVLGGAHEPAASRVQVVFEQQQTEIVHGRDVAQPGGLLVQDSCPVLVPGRQ